MDQDLAHDIYSIEDRILNSQFVRLTPGRRDLTAIFMLIEYCLRSLGIEMTKVLVPTVCPYCAAGCGFFIAVKKERATGIEYMPDHPLSEGALCSKGNAALEILYHQERLTSPHKRKACQNFLEGLSARLH